MVSRIHTFSMMFCAAVVSGCVVIAGTPAAGESHAAARGAAAWSERVVQVTGVREVVMRARGHLHVAQGATDSLTISGPRRSVDAVRVAQSGSLLTLEAPTGIEVDLMPLFAFVYPGDVEMELTLQSVESIHLEGHGDVEIGDLAVDTLRVVSSGHGTVAASAIEAGRFSLRVSNHGEVRIDQLVTARADVDLTGHTHLFVPSVTTRELGVTIEDHASARVSGVVDHQRVVIDDHADYLGRRLNSREASVRAAGHSKARLWVHERLSMDVGRGASLQYDGRPQVIDEPAQESSV